MNTDTPETDANLARWIYYDIHYCHDSLSDDPLPWPDFARKLERERDEAREVLKITQEAWVKAKAERVEALRERDEAREQRDRLADQLDDAVAEATNAVNDIIGMKWQRDRLAEAVNAATILIAAKGRHNTMLAYEGLREALQSLAQKP
jgi:hypothetical protein